MTSVFILRALRQVFPGPELEEGNLADEPPQGSRTSIWMSYLPLCLPGDSREQGLLSTGPRQEWTEIRAFQARGERKRKKKASNIMFIEISAKNIKKNRN